MKRIAIALALAGVSSLATAAQAQTYMFGMDGFQETPPVATPGFGDCTVTLTGLDVSVACTFSGLIGTTTLAHIHGPADFGVSAGVILALTPDVGVTSGVITGGGTLSAAHAAALTSGMTYINLHTTFKPTGEIRGQIVPEPSTMALLAIGSALVARRRRGTA